MSRNSGLSQAAAVAGEEAAAWVRCLPAGPEISAPWRIYLSPIPWRNGTGAPVHETAHALICQALGTRGFHQIPDWFHEGTAEIFRNEEEPKIIRAMNRIRVGLAPNSQLPTPHRMCTGDPGNLPEERNGFYLMATEFTRFLESREGHRILNQVVQGIQAGATFEESMQNQFGKSCEELYTEWLGSW